MQSEPSEAMTPEQQFTDWFVKNYPGPDTIIFNPLWHAPKIFRAARAALDPDIATRTDSPTDAVERATKALADWDRYQPYISNDRIVEQANEMAEILRAFLMARPKSVHNSGTIGEA